MENAEQKEIICESCNRPVMPITKIEYEYDTKNKPTGRYRIFCTRFECPTCLRIYTDGANFPVTDWTKVG